QNDRHPVGAAIRRMLGRGKRYLFWRSLDLRIRFRPAMLVTFRYARVRLSLPRRLLTGEIRSAFENGHYEAGERSIVRKVVRPDDVVVELGAAIGFLSTVLARIAIRGRVHAY